MNTRAWLLLALLGALALYGRKEIAVAVKKLTRGVRNNNPGNIVRTGTKWIGMRPDQSADARFVVFETPEHGIRALARILMTYSRNGLNTVAAIINRWAPPSENDSGAYAAAVAKALKVSPTARIDVATNLPGLVAAIIRHENGYVPYSAATIRDGINMG